MKPFKFVAFAALLSSCGQTDAQLGPGFEKSLEPYASVRDAIRLPDGRMLNFVCMGQGSPTVILTAGMGDFSGWAWSSVQADMAKITKVCAWDRPGLGMSDGSAEPQTVATTAADLETALTTGGIEGPYIMVGHSLGAYESLLFTDRHPEHVVGMVLVDPSYPNQFSVPPVEPPRFLRLPWSEPERDLIEVFRMCAADIRSGKLHANSDDPNGCLAFPPSYPPVLNDALTAKVLGNPLQYESQASFWQSGEESSRLVINPRRNYGSMPLVVLSAMYAPRWPPFTPESLKARMAAEHERINRGQQALAALSSRGVREQVKDASHYIQYDQPQAVIDAVSTVVTQARARKGVPEAGRSSTS
jgi:pimeloyl-ACP methyl ester carboxylesterase